MFAKNLKKLREKNHLTQEDLADSLSVSRQAVCMWERGRRTPKVSVLTKMAKSFGVSLDHIMNNRLTSQENDLEDEKKR